MYRSLAAAAGLALTAANALLVVPLTTVTDADGAIRALPLTAAVDSDSRAVDVPCPRCPLKVSRPRPDGSAVAALDQSIPSHLELRFTVAKGADHDRLLLNDYEVFPDADWTGDLRAVLAADAETEEGVVVEQEASRLGYSMAIHPVAKDEAHGAELVEVSLRIIELEDVFIDDIPTVVAKVVKDKVGRLLIATVETVAESQKDTAAAPTTPAGSECTTVLCRWRAAIAQRLQTLRNKMRPHCGGAKGMGMDRPSEAVSADDEPAALEPAHPSPRPHHGHGHENHHGHGHGNHHGHGPHKNHRSWGQLLRNIASHILFPVLIGIVAGVSASIIGMLVGTFAVCLWRVFVRRQPAFTSRRCRRRGHSCRKAGPREAAADNEKAGLMAAYQDEPPAYDAEDNTPEDRV